MSLINDALKKAQRLRTEDPASLAPPMPGGGSPVAKRAQPRSAQQLVVLAAGGFVLVMLSVVVTVWLVNRPAPVKPAAPPAAHPAPKTATDSTVATPVIVPPVIKPAPSVAETPPPPVEQTPPATASAAPVVQVAPPPIVPTAPPALPLTASPPVTVAPAASPPPSPAAVDTTATAPASPVPAPAALVKTDERVHAFVDAIRVAGIRSSGTDSRVLMNDRVFRVNDIVERNLGIRLTKVESGSLTFTDANGAVYVKNF